MQVVHPLRGVERNPSPVFPAQRDVLILNQAPQRPPRAVLEHNRQIWRLRAGPQEHHDVRVPQRLHGVALGEKVPQSALVESLNFKNFHRDDGLSPFGAPNYSVAALADLLLELDLVEVDLEVRVEDPVLDLLLRGDVHPVDLELGVLLLIHTLRLQRALGLLQVHLNFLLGALHDQR